MPKKKDEIKSEKVSAPTWIKMKPEELESIVVELAQKGESPAIIGTILRDKYGVPKARIMGKRITQILDEKGVSYPGDKEVISSKVDRLKGHLDRNKHDYTAKKSLSKRLWVLHKLQ